VRTRTIYIIAILCVLIGATAFSMIQLATSSSHSLGNFVLSASGTAYDPKHHEKVDVILTVTGTAHGKQKVVINIVARGGSAQVENYGTFALIKGHGLLIQRCHFAFLHIKVTGGYYGGQTTNWNLRGHVGVLQNNAWPVTLSADRIRLPAQGARILHGLFLRGTIALN